MKVRCSECKNQSEGVCEYTKSSVKLNKRRVCDKFKLDATKVKEGTPIPTTRLPSWWHQREELRREYKKKLKELQAKKLEPESEMKYMRDMQHPLTGNLDDYIKSTAPKDEE